jgi:MFS family permease
VLIYATQQLGFSRGVVLNFVMIQSVLSMTVIPIFGHLSDRFGRRTIISIGCVAMMIWPFIYFSLLDTKSIGWVFLAILFALPIQDLQYGPQAAFISESFPGSRRYSGASLGYQLASLTAGGPAPLVAVWLYQKYQTSMAIAVYLAITGVISLACVMLLKDRTGHLDSH